MDKCSICMENLNFENLKIHTTECNHSFHAMCLKKGRLSKCPHCRAVIPLEICTADLFTAEDISVAFNLAINGTGMNWTLAEEILERFPLVRESMWDGCDEDGGDDDEIHEGVNFFLGYVWLKNDFDRNVLKVVNLLKGVDSWRANKFLGLIFDTILDQNYVYIEISVEIFDSLASLLLTKDERNWPYLISKNNGWKIDNGLSRLINSFIYSPKDRGELSYNVLEIMTYFTSERNCKENYINFLNAPNIRKALVKIFVEEKENECLVCDFSHLVYQAVAYRRTDQEPGIEESLQIVRRDFVRCGICEAMMPIVKNLLNSNVRHKHVNMFHAFNIIYFLIEYFGNIPNLISAGLLEILVQYFNSPFKHMDGWSVTDGEYIYTSKYLYKIVGHLCEYDSNIIQKFHELGIAEGSNLFGTHISNEQISLTT